MLASTSADGSPCHTFNVCCTHTKCSAASTGVLTSTRTHCCCAASHLCTQCSPTYVPDVHDAVCAAAVADTRCSAMSSDRQPTAAICTSGSVQVAQHAPTSQMYTTRSALPAVTLLPSGDQSQRSSPCSKLCWWPYSTFSHLQHKVERSGSCYSNEADVAPCRKNAAARWCAAARDRMKRVSPGCP
jgi:hypothetical protein